MLIVRNIVNNTTTNDSGYLLFLAIENELKNSGSVEISLDNISVISTSFLNSSIGEIFEKFGFENVKSKIKYHHVEKSIAEILRKYHHDFPILLK